MQLTALRSRRFRHYFIGHAASILGSWIQQVALSWLIYRVTGSAALLGVAAALMQLPQMLIGPLAGSLIDRYDTRRLFLAALTAGTTLALALAAAVWLHLLGPTVILVAAALTGLTNSIESPLRQSLISQLVTDRALLPNALALNATVFNSARFVGPPLAGLILAATSEAWCFAINAASYAGLLAFAWTLQLAPKPRSSRAVLGLFVDGLRYLSTHWTLKRMLGFTFMQNVATGAVIVLLPVWARDVFAGDSRTLGWLLGASGAGSLFGTILLTRLGSASGWLRVVSFGWVLSIAGTATLAFIPPLPVALVALFSFGCGLTMCNVTTNVITQSVAPDELRGRMVSIFIGGRWGFDALGGLVAGAVASAAGLQPTMLLQLAILLITVTLFLRARARASTEIQRAVEA